MLGVRKEGRKEGGMRVRSTSHLLQVAIVFLLLCANAQAYFWQAKKPTQEGSSTTTTTSNDDPTTVTMNAGSGQCGVDDGGPECPHTTVHIFNNGESDLDERHTVILSNNDCKLSNTEGKDLATVICNRLAGPEGCTLHDQQGNLVDSCDDISDDELLWMVAKGRLFMWPTFEIGRKVDVRDVVSPVAGKKIVLETISQEPKIFRVYNFFSEEESSELIDNALAATDDEYRLKRSSTGAKGYNLDTYRTSENAFDTNSKVALRLKRRAFDLLGIFPYDETLADGLQILRYNQTTAYIDHLDWIEPMLGSDHNWDSTSDEGTNRYATILLYLTDVTDGGETLFSKAHPASIAYVKGQQVDSDQVPFVVDGPNTVKDSLTLSEDEEATATSYLNERNITHLFPDGSWQRKMVGKCRSRLALKPRRAEAILFYSQFPDGSPDRLSLHAGCPVLEGEKWAANLWVWNGARHGYWKKNEATGKSEKVSLGANKPVAISAIFKSMDVVGGMLYWEDTFWADLLPVRGGVGVLGGKWISSLICLIWLICIPPPCLLLQGKEVAVNTFNGHKWHVRMGDSAVASWVITAKKPVQRFYIHTRDLPTYP